MTMRTVKLNLDTTWRWVVVDRLRSHNPWRKTPAPTGEEAGWASELVWTWRATTRIPGLSGNHTLVVCPLVSHYIDELSRLLKSLWCTIDVIGLIIYFIKWRREEEEEEKCRFCKQKIDSQFHRVTIPLKMSPRSVEESFWNRLLCKSSAAVLKGAGLQSTWAC